MAPWLLVGEGLTIALLFIADIAGWCLSVKRLSFFCSGALARQPRARPHAFGCGHIDQGLPGTLENVWNGFLLGAPYLACQRNLMVPIVAHGVADTIDLVLIYAGAYPGLT